MIKWKKSDIVRVIVITLIIVIAFILIELAISVVFNLDGI